MEGREGGKRGGRSQEVERKIEGDGAGYTRSESQISAHVDRSQCCIRIVVVRAYNPLLNGAPTLGRWLPFLPLFLSSLPPDLRCLHSRLPFPPRLVFRARISLFPLSGLLALAFFVLFPLLPPARRHARPTGLPPPPPCSLPPRQPGPRPPRIPSHHPSPPSPGPSLPPSPAGILGASAFCLPWSHPHAIFVGVCLRPFGERGGAGTHATCRGLGRQKRGTNRSVHDELLGQVRVLERVSPVRLAGIRVPPAQIWRRGCFPFPGGEGVLGRRKSKKRKRMDRALLGRKAEEILGHPGLREDEV